MKICDTCVKIARVIAKRVRPIDFLFFIIIGGVLYYQTIQIKSRHIDDPTKVAKAAKTDAKKPKKTQDLGDMLEGVPKLGLDKKIDSKVAAKSKPTATQKKEASNEASLREQKAAAFIPSLSPAK